MVITDDDGDIIPRPQFGQSKTYDQLEMDKAEVLLTEMVFVTYDALGLGHTATKKALINLHKVLSSIYEY